MKTIFIGAVVVFVLALGWYAFFMLPAGEISTPKEKEEKNTPALQENKTSKDMTVTLKTTQGDIVIKLYSEKMPITAGNFYELAQSGFYNGTKIHRVIEGFIIQGGDPNSKGDDATLYGRGGPGYTIEDEFVAGLSNVKGTISMANSGPNSGGSQFFINLADNTGLDYDKEPLSSKHPVFGEVVEGMDVVLSLSRVPTGAGDIPRTPVVIESVVVE